MKLLALLLYYSIGLITLMAIICMRPIGWIIERETKHH